MGSIPYWRQRALGLALALALPLAAAQAQTFLPVPLNLSNTGHALSPSVSVGPGGDIDVVWLDAGQILFRRSVDGGKSFSGAVTVTSANLPPAGSGTQPQIAASSAGVYVTWAGANASGGGDVFFSSLPSGANTWTAPMNVSNGSGISGDTAPVPHMTVDPNGGVDIVWGQAGAYFRRFANGSFSATVQLTGAAMAKVSPRIAIGPQGNVYIVWANAGSCPAIMFARSTNSGASFTNYAVADQLTIGGQTAMGCASDAQIAVGAPITAGAANTIHLLWANDSPIQDLITTYAADSDFTAGVNGFPETNEAGNTFENLSPTSSFTPQMAIDGSGKINVAWIGDFNTNGAPRVVYFSRGDNSKTFSTPQALTSPPQSNWVQSSLAQVVTEPSGAVDILFEQASGSNPTGAFDVVLARSTDGSAFKNTTLDSAPTTQAGTAQIAADGSGNVYAVWQGSTSAGSDVLLNGDSAALTSPGFALSLSAGAQSVLAGGTVNVNVTVVAIGGFSQSVALSCPSVPAGMQCSFNPATLTPTSSVATATLNVTTPGTITPGSFTVSVSASGGGITQTQNLQVTVGGISASVSPGSATINVGGSANLGVTLSSTNSFAGPVNLVCTGAPAGVTCSLSPGSVNLAANGSATTTMSVAISAKPAGSLAQWRPPVGTAARGTRFLALLMLAIGFTLMLLLMEAGRRKWPAARLLRTTAIVLLLAGVAASITSCGGSTSNGGGGGGGSVTFPLTLQAKAGSASVNLQTVSITVP